MRHVMRENCKVDLLLNFKGSSHTGFPLRLTSSYMFEGKGSSLNSNLRRCRSEKATQGSYGPGRPLIPAPRRNDGIMQLIDDSIIQLCDMLLTYFPDPCWRFQSSHRQYNCTAITLRLQQRSRLLFQQILYLPRQFPPCDSREIGVAGLGVQCSSAPQPPDDKHQPKCHA